MSNIGWMRMGRRPWDLDLGLGLGGQALRAGPISFHQLTPAPWGE